MPARIPVARTMRVDGLRALVAVVAVVVATSSAACATPAPAAHVGARPGPVLLLTHGTCAPSLPTATATATAGSRGATFALAALPPTALGELRDALDDLALYVETKRNPLVADLLDDDVEQVLANALADHAPRLSAARALAAGRWASGDRDLVVTLGARCEEAPDARCLALWPDDAERANENAEAARARFIAWPLAHAAVLRATDGDAVALARTLRAGGPGATGDDPIALILTRSVDVAARASLAEVGRAAAGARDGIAHDATTAAALGDLLDDLAHADPDSLGTLPIESDQVLVVPRLHAIADPASFARALDHRLAQRGVSATWVHAPR